MKGLLIAVMAMLGFINAAHAASLPVTISINPAATFLETINDAPVATTIPISLSSLGLASGQTILLTEQGSFNFCCGQSTGMIGLFSSSSLINASVNDGSNPNRVPGAIAFAGSGLSTIMWDYGNNLNNSIAQDFFINTAGAGGTTVKIPTGAHYLFVAAADSWYNDNSLNGSPGFAVTIASVTPVPEPETCAMLLAGLGLIGFIACRRKNGAASMMMAA